VSGSRPLTPAGNLESTLASLPAVEGGEVRPGEINAHTHLYSGLAGLGMPAPAQAPTSFLQILERVWWRLDRALDEASLRASARLYLAEALLAGCTTVLDHHESPGLIDGSLDLLAEEARALGIRLAVTYGATERNGGRREAQAGLAECARFLKSNTLTGRFPLVRGLVGLHATFTVGDESVREAGELCRALEVPLHVHVAEDKADVDDAVKRGYAGPLERLEKLGALLPGSILAHGVWLSEAQVRRAESAGAWLVQNPRSNANNKVGWPRAHSASKRVALGTDGFAAVMQDEQRALREEAARNGDPLPDSVYSGRIGGARRLAEEIFGKRFDGGLGGESAGDLALGVPGERPQHVLVGGSVVVRGGRLEHHDLEEIRAHAREQAARLWSRMAALP
jgi:cytosine/adenosine deaminase-related metal-dependent hydrolase